MQQTFYPVTESAESPACWCARSHVPFRSLKPEYIIADQQGNARISFEDNGSGAPIVRQENSYYGLGAGNAGQPGSHTHNAQQTTVQRRQRMAE
ncbi:hypothetical protein ACFJIV_14220 [Mucilaginibacter sp. UC70_90]